jgi:hypothetical protein
MRGARSWKATATSCGWSGDRLMGRKPEPAVEYQRFNDGVLVRPRNSLKMRRSPSKGRIEAFDQLHERLAAAAVVAESHGDGGRQGVDTAIRGVISYLIARGLKPATIAPLRLVLDALDDAQRGVRSPIFEVVKRKGAPPKSERARASDWIVAAIAELCIRQQKSDGVGNPAQQGALTAAKMIRTSRLALNLSCSRILKIRERVSELPPDERIEFDTMLLALPEGISPQDFAAQLAVSPSLGANQISR